MARRRSSALFLTLACAACLAPVIVLFAALGARTGVWSVETAYDLLTLRVAFALSFAGLLAAAGALFLAAKGKGNWPAAVGAGVVAVATVAGFYWHQSRLSADQIEDVSTDLVQIPGFDRLASARGRGGPARTVGVEACPGAVFVATQSLPEAVVYELQQEGVTVRRAGVTGVYGSREGLWFGFTEDVAVRIRPGRTDIRVAARDDRPHGGSACGLLTRIADRLRVGA